MPTQTLTPDVSRKTMSTESTSLERAAERTPPIIKTPDEYRSALLRWQEQRYNILTAFANVSAMAEQHGLLTSLVQLSTEKTSEDTYDNSGGPPWLKDGEFAIAKRGLRKIAECAGISTTTTRTDPRTIPNYWEFKAIASYRGLDGGIVQREASQEWDLRDGSERLKGFRPNQITEARKNGLRNCEARAINAAIRECGCGVKQKYSRAELERPFVGVRVMFLPDMTDPETRRLVTERALGATTALYPAAERALSAVAEQVIDAEPVAATRPQSPAPAATSTASSGGGPVDPNQPPVPGAVRIAKIETRSGERRDKTTWTRYTIIDTNGVEHSTFDAAIAQAAEKAKASGQWVELTEESAGEFRNLVELTPAGQQPSLLPDPSRL